MRARCLRCCLRCCLAAPRAQASDIPTELRKLHALRKAAFDPDNVPAHEVLLRGIWRALAPSAQFSRRSKLWKEIGFQGEDPSTDVGASGCRRSQAAPATRA